MSIITIIERADRKNPYNWQQIGKVENSQNCFIDEYEAAKFKKGVEYFYRVRILNSYWSNVASVVF